MTFDDSQANAAILEKKQPTSWKHIALLIVCGLALGAGFFALIHPYEGGFRSTVQSGAIVDRMPLDTILESLLSPVGAFCGAVVALACIPFLKRPLTELPRRALTVLLVMGTMSVVQSSLQMRYDYQQTFGDSSGWTAGAIGGAR